MLRMLRPYLFFALTIATMLVGGPVLATAQDAARGSSSLSPNGVIEEYCVRCHNERQKTGGLVLENLDIEERSPDVAVVREKIVRKVRAGVMPPARSPRPDEAVQMSLVSRLERINDEAAELAPNPGRPLVHRLNRAEYSNAIRDLLGLAVDGRALLPADDSSYGFDNVADVLSISPTLLERYLLAARKISRIAVADPTLRPDVASYSLPSSLLQMDRMSEDLPFGTRGGLSVRHHFPVDGEYEISLTLQRNSINLGKTIRGLDQDALVHVLLDGRKVHEVVVRGSDLPKDPPGLQRPLQRKYNAAVESSLRIRIPVQAGPHQLGATFARSYWYVEGLGVDRLPLASDGYNNGLVTSPVGGRVDLEVASVDVFGPFNGVPGLPGGDRIFSCQPGPGAATEDEEACATEILSRLARLAYRRPLNADDLSVLMSFYQTGRAKGRFAQGIQTALERILVSPYFLLRKEVDPPSAVPGSPVLVDDIDLASRMSFFLWSSVPDDELLQAAESGQLGDPAVLEQQVARMLQDSRSQALRENFFGQWLYLRNLSSHAPDPRLFPRFNDTLREAFERETELFLASQLREDRSALDLFTANYTFVNEHLAEFYAIPNVQGGHFRRVTLSPDSPRLGLLGQGSILSVTSYAHRTSPVLRGKWLLENVLGTPPPPPPPDVPDFPDDDAEGAPKSVRARMELHRRNPVCATCHAQIDPLGFALENFDAIGRYRTLDNGTPIDPSGTLPDGSQFDGPAEFRQVLLSKQDELMTTLTEKLLIYALGRGVEYFDQPAIRQINREAAEDEYRWSSLITSLVKSVPFRMRRAS